MEQMIPSAMVPGLVTISDKKGAMQNVFPIDALELIKSGEYTLVENGAVEAARMNANPLRSSHFGTNPDFVVAEVTGIAGAVIVAATEKSAEDIIAAGDQPDAVTEAAEAAAKAAADKLEADKKAAAAKAAEDAATEEAAKKLAQAAADKAKADAAKK